MSEDGKQGGGNNALIIVIIVLGAVCLGCGGLGALMWFGVSRATEETFRALERSQEAAEGILRLTKALAEARAAGEIPAEAAGDDLGALLLERGRISPADLVDPWGHDYRFRKTETGWHVISVGEDGIAGTPDDRGSPSVVGPDPDESDPDEGR